MRKLLITVLAIATLAVPQLPAAWSGDLDVQQIWNAVYDSATDTIQISGSMSITAPVTAVTTGGDEIANEATLEAARVLLASLDGKDFSTETTLAALNALVTSANALLTSMDTSLTSLDGKDYATQTTLAALLAAVATEATLATRASEATLATRASEATVATLGTEATLATLALEATQLLIEGRIGQVEAYLNTKTATEATLEAARVLLAALDATLTSLDGKDFATQTTLATLGTEATLATMALEATQLAGNALLTTIDVDTGSMAPDIAQIELDMIAVNTQTLAGSLSMASIDTKTPALGQTTMSGSVPVVLPSDQTAIPVNDDGGSITVDGSISAIQSGGWTVDIGSAIPAGSNNIGDFDLASAIPAGSNNIGDFDLASAIPAGTNVIGQVRPATTSDTIESIYMTFSSTGEQQILAAGGAGVEYRIVAVLLSSRGGKADGTVHDTVTQSSTNVVAHFDPANRGGWLIPPTNMGKLLATNSPFYINVANIDASTTVSVTFWYIEE